MSRKTEPADVEKKQSVPKPVPLSPSDAWDLRPLVDRLAHLHAEVRRVEAECVAVARRACAAQGVEYDPRMTLRVENGVVYLVPEVVE